MSNCWSTHARAAMQCVTIALFAALAVSAAAAREPSDKPVNYERLFKKSGSAFKRGLETIQQLPPEERLAAYDELKTAAENIRTSNAREEVKARARQILCGDDKCMPPTRIITTEGETVLASDVEGDFKKVTRVSAPFPPFLEKGVLRRSVTGLVVLELLISTDGEVENIRVVETPSVELAAHVSETVREWRYEPATLDGKPVAVHYGVSIDYRMKYWL